MKNQNVPARIDVPLCVLIKVNFIYRKFPLVLLRSYCDETYSKLYNKKRTKKREEIQKSQKLQMKKEKGEKKRKKMLQRNKKVNK